MSDLIQTINSEDEIDYLDDSEDEFQEKVFTKKDREEMLEPHSYRPCINLRI